jgi:hypothetical protein
MKHLLSRKVQQALGTNLEGEEVAEATEDVVAQVVVVVVVDTRAGGVVEVEVPNCRATQIDCRTTRIDYRAI